MGTLKGFPNPPATLRSRHCRLAPHATKMETLTWKHLAPRKRGEVAEHSEAGEGCFFV